MIRKSGNTCALSKYKERPNPLEMFIFISALMFRIQLVVYGSYILGLVTAILFIGERWLDLKTAGVSVCERLQQTSFGAKRLQRGFDSHCWNTSNQVHIIHTQMVFKFSLLPHKVSKPTVFESVFRRRSVWRWWDQTKKDCSQSVRLERKTRSR